MFQVKLIRSGTKIGFMERRRITYALSGTLMVLSVILFFVHGLNFGIDFRGGILMEVRTPGTADLALMRKTLDRLDLGDVAIQTFGAEDDVLIRIERQPGDAEAQEAAVARVKQALNKEIGEGISYRRVEVVGPKVSGELI